MQFEKKIHVKKRSQFFKRKKKRLKYEFKLKANFFHKIYLSYYYIKYI